MYIAEMGDGLDDGAARVGNECGWGGPFELRGILNNPDQLAAPPIVAGPSAGIRAGGEAQNSRVQAGEQGIDSEDQVFHAESDGPTAVAAGRMELRFSQAHG